MNTPVLTIFGPIEAVNGMVPRTPELDGVPLTGLTGIKFECRVGELTKVTLEFVAMEARVIEGCEIRGQVLAP